MRHRLLPPGAEELSYEIRAIVKKATELSDLGLAIEWENIGDPVQKSARIPPWMKEVLHQLIDKDSSFAYCHSKGVLATRRFLAERTNARGGAQVSPEDILFFNGLGDAISTLYTHLDVTSRIIGPAPGYSTHSSAEAAHAHQRPITFKLDPARGWLPDLDELEQKVELNPSITGILIINPDNPTGMVYLRDALERVVDIARQHDLFVICDEIYNAITYNGGRAYTLSEVIGDVPGIAMKGISKELPWPGSRCGWMEFYNRGADAEFNRFCSALENAKMVEVCATTLPQTAIPMILAHPAYPAYRAELNQRLGVRSRFITDTLGPIPGLMVNEAHGAFYHTFVFDDGALNPQQHLKIDRADIRGKVEQWVDGVGLDYRFVYYLLGATGICVVPASSFCTELMGFRITALEEDDDKMRDTTSRMAEAIREYLASSS